jgi:hypothetical protein
MKTENAVYKLAYMKNDPRYEGFAGMLPKERFPRTDGRMKRNWRMRRFARGWKPIKVIGRVRAFNDNPGMLGCPAFSQRAVDALRDLLEPNGEILPLSTPIGPYFAFNVTKVADVLDWKKSDVDWIVNRKPFNALRIYKYVFFPKKLKDLAIFVSPEDPMGVYVTETFVQRVRQHGLNGFLFLKVWPLPEGTNLWELHKETREKQMAKMGLPAGQTITGNMVMLFLKLADPKSKGNKSELAQIKRLAGQLDALLVDNSQDVPVGSLVGIDFKSGNCRMILSCPDADALEKKLAPLLKQLDWPNGFTVKKIRKSFEELKDTWD